VITRQFVFEGNALRVNADCANGYLTVEVLDPHFEPYPGFEATACVPIHVAWQGADASHIWQTVAWQGADGTHADLRTLWNKPCRLRVRLYGAALYAFQFYESE
jgi:hypothetical protein